ncbi:outer membrane beta-barrel protein [Chryseobacterium flavum]|uniref:outer membrane beta-barrel protein n=1 Tax=Chryseobacterium flavum TaxID=415851 RepID=UPI0028AD68BF|nr:outer membrane beta-barrel protein [Chryseobacterium flavum]
MKKLVLTGGIVLFSLSHAQIKRGSVYLSGQMEYQHNENNVLNGSRRKDDIVKIIPTAGYFVGSNLAIGLGAGYKSAVSKYEIGYGGASNSHQIKVADNAFVVTPFIRKYWTLSDHLYIFGQLQVPLEFGREKLNSNNDIQGGDPLLSSSFNTKNNYTSIGVNIKPGLDYFLSKNWSVEAVIGEFGYNTYKKDVDGAKRVNDYKFGLNLSSVTFGIKYLFTN